jgi:hypothetical protein
MCTPVSLVVKDQRLYHPYTEEDGLGIFRSIGGDYAVFVVDRDTWIAIYDDPHHERMYSNQKDHRRRRPISTIKGIFLRKVVDISQLVKEKLCK